MNRETPKNLITDDESFDLEDVFQDIAATAVEEAVKKLNNGKAPGIDNTRAELLKEKRRVFGRKMQELLSEVWRFEVILEAWKKGPIIKLPQKGKLKDCKNSRGVTLLSAIGKILGRTVFDRVRNGVNERLRKEQAGYRRHSKEHT